MRTTVHLRPAAKEDEDFLFHLYCDTRAEEVKMWGLATAQAEALLHMQYDARQRSYEFQFADAENSIVLLDRRPVGRMLVCKSGGEFRLVDIALLADTRGAGIGRRLLEDLQAEAQKAGKPVRLHVEKSNPAIRLYERLGFVTIADKGAYIQMERASLSGDNQ